MRVWLIGNQICCPAASIAITSVIAIVMVLLPLLLVTNTAFALCPICKSGLLDSPEGQQMAQGFNRGIGSC